MKKDILLFFLFIFLLNACSQDKNQKDKVIDEIFSKELRLTKNKRAGQIFYIINSMSCETCIEMNLDYFSNNYDLHNINLILINKSGFSRFENFANVLKSESDIYMLKEEQIALYKIRTLDPLLVVFDKNGELFVSKNIVDDKVFQLNQIIDEIVSKKS
ncbi:hypothetical protein [Marivirga sp.]|uniref:hypothetical protein n=1 Tax=Marivirga sp. TaxID=2018662 RepID=UPI002D7E99C3|nr:hypothetical protein [Marivirga sp.]HET8860527.1 hypothetical protein [Marivirga sp.]